MRKIVLVFIAVVLTVSGFAQKSADIGIWGGSSTYWGDMKETPPLQTFNLNVGAFFRYNFNSRMALRTMFITGNHSAEGFLENEKWEFNKNAQDISVMMEINFLKYILGEKKTPFTPYIMGGMGVMYFPYEAIYNEYVSIDPSSSLPGNLDMLLRVNINHPLGEGRPNIDDVQESVIAPALAFGFGIKFSVGARLGVGIEYQLRKLFDDKFDDLDDPLSFETDNNNGDTETIKYTDFWHNNDWPGFLGIHLTYSINLDRKACPAYDRKYW